MNVTDENIQFDYAGQIRSGFVAVVGKPNVGKSTLINTIVGQKVAIISSKPQTTRHRILGVKNGDGYQIVFVDTPGIHRVVHQLGRYMENTYKSEIKNADLIVFLADAAHDAGEEDKIALKILFRGKDVPDVPVYLAMNKIDITDTEVLEKRCEYFESAGKFKKVFRISALTGKGVDELMDYIVQVLPPGPPYFPPGQLSDQSPELQASEIVREKVLENTRQEVPHCVFVHTEELREGATPDLIYIRELIYVERKSQKGIIIGKEGKRLKRIGTLARRELELLFQKKVYLDLWVKVKEDWRERKDLLRSWGYEL